MRPQPSSMVFSPSTVSGGGGTKVRRGVAGVSQREATKPVCELLPFFLSRRGCGFPTRATGIVCGKNRMAAGARGRTVMRRAIARG